MTRTLALVCLLLLAPTATAQLPVQLTGTVERLPGTACNPTATHQVRCANVLLQSSVVDLTLWEGRTVELTGTSTGTPSCAAIDVATVQAASQATTAFALLGFRPGRPVLFTTTAPVGALVSYWFGTGPGFLPLGPFGSLLLDPVGAVYWTSDISIGIALRTVQIPNDPTLSGLQIFMQTSAVTLTPLGARLLNPTCFTIQ